MSRKVKFRVKLSELGHQTFATRRQRVPMVLGWAHQHADPNCLTVLWDGRKVPDVMNKKFVVEKVEE